MSIFDIAGDRITTLTGVATGGRDNEIVWDVSGNVPATLSLSLGAALCLLAGAAAVAHSVAGSGGEQTCERMGKHPLLRKGRHAFGQPRAAAKEVVEFFCA